jgi:enamine deaminase RidA (YjgF/YER057c/UK114 family)
MITRFPGLTPTRSRATATDDLVFTVAVSPDPSPPTVYEQAVKVFARIDESLAMCGTDKSKVLSALILLNDVTTKAELNRAWDEWVDKENPPMRACVGVDIEPPHLVEIIVTATK